MTGRAPPQGGPPGCYQHDQINPQTRSFIPLTPRFLLPLACSVIILLLVPAFLTSESARTLYYRMVSATAAVGTFPSRPYFLLPQILIPRTSLSVVHDIIMTIARTNVPLVGFPPFDDDKSRRLRLSSHQY